MALAIPLRDEAYFFFLVFLLIGTYHYGNREGLRAMGLGRWDWLRVAGWGFLFLEGLDWAPRNGKEEVGFDRLLTSRIDLG